MTESSFQELIIRQKESGLSVRDFCSNEGVAPSTYYYWLKKLNRKAAQPGKFVPLLISDQFPGRKKNLMPRPAPAGSGIHHEDALLEFVFPNGTRLMVRDPVGLPLLQTLAHLYD